MDISLTSSQRSSLISLKKTQDLETRTLKRLSTGERVSTVNDDAVNFFRARALNDRASDFNERKDGIDQGISALNVALNSMQSIDQLLAQIKGIAEAAKSQTAVERASATTQYQTVLSQISQIIEDSSYQGLNLLNSTSASLDVSFGVRSASRLVVNGLALNASSASPDSLFQTGSVFNSAGDRIGIPVGPSFGAAPYGFSANGTDYAQEISEVMDRARSRLRGFSSKIGTNIAILQTRLSFTNDYISELSAGADKLTLADLNEEGANLSALQVRQQLGLQALSVAGNQQQQILNLIQ